MFGNDGSPVRSPRLLDSLREEEEGGNDGGEQVTSPGGRARNLNDAAAGHASGPRQILPFIQPRYRERLLY